jgi:hypothetical protein
MFRGTSFGPSLSKRALSARALAGFFARTLAARLFYLLVIPLPGSIMAVRGAAVFWSGERSLKRKKKKRAGDRTEMSKKERLLVGVGLYAVQLSFLKISLP